MVLQQAPIQSVIWGLTTTDTNTVTLAIDGTVEAKSTPDLAGHFHLTLPAYAASTTNHTLDISDGVTVVTLSDVLFGDVFFCAGQSNMEFGVRPTIGGIAAINDSARYTYLRLYSAAEQIAASPAYDSTTRFLDGAAWVR
jgi:sialate O-acetylesterase